MTTMTIDAPERAPAFNRSRQQRLEALDRANAVRVRRAQLKRDLKAGRASIHALLLNPPEFVETAKVSDLLLHVPKYGRVKVNKILTQCRVSPSKTFGGLSSRQRDELAALLRRAPVALRHAPDGRAARRVTVRDQLIVGAGMHHQDALSLLRRLRIPAARTAAELTPRQTMQIARAIEDAARERRRQAVCGR